MTKNILAEDIIARLQDEDVGNPDDDDYIPVMDQLEAVVSGRETALALTMARNADTRQSLCDLLGRLRDPDGLDALLVALRDDSVKVRAAAADAIGKVFGYVSDPPLDRRDHTLEQLIERWRVEASDAVRSTLAQTLALLGDPVVRPLLEAALDAADYRVRGQARWGLGYLDRKNSATQ